VRVSVYACYVAWMPVKDKRHGDGLYKIDATWGDGSLGQTGPIVARLGLCKLQTRGAIVECSKLQMKLMISGRCQSSLFLEWRWVRWVE
jgi:hypothetical protein